jgi:hypothetical protein
MAETIASRGRRVEDGFKCGTIVLFDMERFLAAAGGIRGYRSYSENFPAAGIST